MREGIHLKHPWGGVWCTCWKTMDVPENSTPYRGYTTCADCLREALCAASDRFGPFEDKNMCEHEMLRDANDNVIIVSMQTLAKPHAADIGFPARICEKCRSVYVPQTVSKSFENMGKPGDRLTR